MRPYRQLLVVAGIPGLLLICGTLGYIFIEGWGFFDAFYMSVVTLSTVGFGETHPLTPAGRAFTAVLILAGVSSFAAAVTAVIRVLVSGELMRPFAKARKEKRLHTLQDHVVVCGFGRMGRLVCRELQAKNLPFVVIEQDEQKVLQEFPGALVVQGDATHDHRLREAGIEHARVLIVVLPSDSDNLFITMSARLLNEHVFIIARAEDISTETKLKKAGANRVVSPYVLGGAHVVQAVLRPTLLEFIDLATQTQHLELQLEEVSLQDNSPLVGRSCVDEMWQRASVILIALQRPGEKMRFRPGQQDLLEAGDVLVILGHRDALDEVQTWARGETG